MYQNSVRDVFQNVTCEYLTKAEIDALRQVDRERFNLMETCCDQDTDYTAKCKECLADRNCRSNEP